MWYKSETLDKRNCVNKIILRKNSSHAYHTSHNITCENQVW